MTDPERDGEADDWDAEERNGADRAAVTEAEVAERLDAILQNLQQLDAFGGEPGPAVETAELGGRRRSTRWSAGDRGRPAIAPVLTAKRAIDHAGPGAEPDFYDLLKYRVAQQSRLARGSEVVGEEDLADRWAEDDDDADWMESDSDFNDDGTWQARGTGLARMRLRPAVLLLGLIVLGGAATALIALSSSETADPDGEPIAVTDTRPLPVATLLPDPGSQGGSGALLPQRPRVVAASPAVEPVAPPPAALPAAVEEASATLPPPPAPSSPAPPVVTAEWPIGAEPAEVAESAPAAPPLLDDTQVALLPSDPIPPLDEPAPQTPAPLVASDPLDSPVVSERPTSEVGALAYLERVTPDFPDFEAPAPAPSGNRQATPATTTARAAVPAIQPGTATTNAYVNMRAGPQNEAASIVVIPAGKTVRVAACDAWCRIEYEGRSGYVYPRFLDQR